MRSLFHFTLRDKTSNVLTTNIFTADSFENGSKFILKQLEDLVNGLEAENEDQLEQAKSMVLKTIRACEVVCYAELDCYTGDLIRHDDVLIDLKEFMLIKEKTEDEI